MSFEYIRLALNAKNIKRIERAVLVTIADYADDNGVSYPAISTIANVSGFCVRAVNNALNNLMEMGAIVIEERRNGREHHTNKYHIQADFLAGNNRHEKAKTSSFFGTETDTPPPAPHAVPPACGAYKPITKPNNSTPEVKSQKDDDLKQVVEGRDPVALWGFYKGRSVPVFDAVQIRRVATNFDAWEAVLADWVAEGWRFASPNNALDAYTNRINPKQHPPPSQRSGFVSNSSAVSAANPTQPVYKPSTIILPKQPHDGTISQNN